MTMTRHTWLAAQYHMPALYSIRVPMTSPLGGRALPAPGPATIQLALLRVGIELFGLDFARDELLPMIRVCRPLVRPPAFVAVSDQLIHAFKADESGHIEEGPAYRAFAHCRGTLTVFMSVPSRSTDVFSDLFNGVGYWGQANSFAVCGDISEAEPEPGSYAQRLESIRSGQAIGRYFTSFVTELRDESVTWKELCPQRGGGTSSPLRIQLYVWPLIMCEHSSTDQLLQYCSLLPENHRHSRHAL